MLSRLVNLPRNIGNFTFHDCLDSLFNINTLTRSCKWRKQWPSIGSSSFFTPPPPSRVKKRGAGHPGSKASHRVPKKSILVIYVNRGFFLRQLKQSISFKLKWQSYNIHGGLICKEAE